MDYNDKLICVDLDWTLCEWEFWWLKEPIPKEKRIKFLNDNVYHKWWHIIIYTARSPVYYQLTLAWLIKYWVKHHWIAMQFKPWADLYIDDKAINDKIFFKD
jgi:hypothetical protein